MPHRDSGQGRLAVVAGLVVVLVTLVYFVHRAGRASPAVAEPSRSVDRASASEADLGTAAASQALGSPSANPRRRPPPGEPDAGALPTPESLGLTPVALEAGAVPDVPAEIRLTQATGAVARFAERAARLEDERRTQLSEGTLDTVRLDQRIAVTRQRLAIAELAERSIRDEIRYGQR